METNSQYSYFSSTSSKSTCSTSSSINDFTKFGIGSSTEESQYYLECFYALNRFLESCNKQLVTILQFTHMIQSNY